MVYDLDSEASRLMTDIDGPGVCKTLSIPYYPNLGKVVRLKRGGHLLCNPIHPIAPV